MQNLDLIDECIKKGIPVIDNTRTEADFRSDRFKQEEENLSKHVYIGNVKDEGCRIDPETNGVVRRISFDYHFFMSCLHLNEMHDFTEGSEADHKQKIAEQLFAAMEQAGVRL